MPITQTFYRISEKRPAHEANIVYIVDNTFYSHYELRHGEVYYQWDILDDDGRPSGSSIVYTEGEPQPEGTRLAICADRSELGPNTLWADMDALWAQIEEADKPAECSHSVVNLDGRLFCVHCGREG
jgi:hypothetical protein